VIAPQKPSPSRFTQAVGRERVLSGSEHRENARKLRDELATCDPFSIIEQRVVEEPTKTA
jgi:hypothetical protein